MVYTLDYILNDIEAHLNKKEPFSLVRLGDGDLKLLASVIENKVNKQKFARSGIPFDKGKWILKLYQDACNTANYTSSFEMYYTDTFWSRAFSSGTSQKIRAWKRIYKRVGITNKNYCNPEVGYLLFLNEDRNLLKLIRGRRVCLITSHPQAARRLRKTKIQTSIIKIPGINSGHYGQYNRITKNIRKAIPKHDIFLISAGLLGKGYSNTIKSEGGISIDIGQAINTWAGRRIAKRFKGILSLDDTRLTFNLTKRVKKYRSYL